MEILAIALLGIGLSFDTFAVSITCGLIEKQIRFFRASRIAIIFAIFQALMPVLGCLLGLAIKDYVVQIDHWVAFTLLSLVGIKMIYESFNEEEEKPFNPQDLKVIILMSFATTIDAFAVGITLAFMNTKLLLTSIIIGFITYVAAMLGMLFGKNLGSHMGKKMEIAGGIILIALGVKILLEHLLA